MSHLLVVGDGSAAAAADADAAAAASASAAIMSGRPSRLLISSSSPTSTTTMGSFGYPEAFHAHNHKTPERSNRQKKQRKTPATAPATPGTPDDLTHHDNNLRKIAISGSISPTSTNTGSIDATNAPRRVGRLRPQQFNLFGSNNNRISSVGSVAQDSRSSTTTYGASVSTTNASPNLSEAGNAGNGLIQDQVARQQEPEQVVAAHAHVSHNNNENNNVTSRSILSPPNPKHTSYSCSTTAETTGGAVAKDDTACNMSTAFSTVFPKSSASTSAAAIPLSHVNIITQAYGSKADIYRDILQIPPDMTSDREIRIAYFRRGRQVLAERPGTSNKHPTSGCGNVMHHDNVSQLAKMKFQAVSMAYEILSNPIWKDSYDQHGLFGPSTFQEPPGMKTLLAEDDSPSAESSKTNLEYAQMTSAAKLSSLRSSATTNSSGSSGSNRDGTTNGSTCTETTSNQKPPHSQTPPPTRPRPTKTSKKNIISNIDAADTYSNIVTPLNDKTNNDNGSCVSQSTAGTASSSVLRKPGSFLEKLNKHKAGLSNPGQYLSNVKQGNITTVRWNEEVEELIFRQDPEEIVFKTGNNNSDTTTSKTSLLDSVDIYPYQGNIASCNPNNNYNNICNENSVVDQLVGNTFYKKEPHPMAVVGAGDKVLPSSLRSRDNNDKRRVVLDTAELGSHLEKLDKVADSIADIFDELEASFDGLLGGFKSSTSARQHAVISDAIAGVLSNKQSLLTSPSQQLLASGLSQDQLPISSATIEENGMLASHTVGMDQRHFEKASYHTVPISIGSRREASLHEGMQLPTLSRLSKEEEEAQVEEQAMALLREVTAIDPILPPSGVVVKTKNQHSSPPLRQGYASAASGSYAMGDTASIDGQEVLGQGQQLQQQQQAQTDQRHDTGGEATCTSTCASDMAAGGENATVATSVVSLLDPQQHTNAPLKPAATTATTGAKASRKRLKNVQRRRQHQQRAKEQQQLAMQQGSYMSLDDPFNHASANGNHKLSAKERTNQINQFAKASFAEAQKKSKRKSEDIYFESLYQNFFALPKERSPNEMVVRTKPPRSGCSVSTISESIATAPKAKLDFDPWDLANNAFSSFGADDGDKARRSKHHREVMARVDEMLSKPNGLDMTYDSSFADDFGLDTTMESGAMDTTFDSTAVDTEFTSALGHRKANHVAAAAITGCEGTPAAAFLKNVFDVPLEAPLEFWCGEMKDCSASIDASAGNKKLIAHRRIKQPLQQKQLANFKGDNSSTECTSSFDGSSAILDDDDDGFRTDESMTLLDPPTHDSRLFEEISRCDDSTLNTCDGNSGAERGAERDEETMSQPEPKRDPSVASAAPSAGPQLDIDEGNDATPIEEADTALFIETTTASSDPPLEDAIDLVRLETARLRQFVASGSREISLESEQLEIDPRHGIPDEDGGEEREDISPLPTNTMSSFPTEIGSYPSEPETDYSTDVVPQALSSMSARRSGIDSCVATLEEDDEQDGQSIATSVTSTVSKDKEGSSSFLAYLKTYVQDVMESDNPSLACIKSNLTYGSDPWGAPNESCMGAIIITEDDVDGILEILQHEMDRPTPPFMPKPQSSE